MGTKKALADFSDFIGKLEEKLRELGEPNILIWRCLIDDIFIIIIIIERFRI